MLFKKFFLIILVAVLLAVVLVALIQIPGMAKTRLQKMLVEAGFTHVKVEHASLRPTGIHASDIKLDEFGFDAIKSLDADVNWPAFFAGHGIKSLTIDGMAISREPGTLASGTRQLMTNLLNLPPYRLSLTNTTIDLGTAFGDIRMTMDATSEPKSGEKSHDIKARLKAEQYQLGFDSTWEGTLGEGGVLDLAGTVLDGRANVGPLRISRFNGWAGLSVNKDGYTAQSQLEAGSAAFMDVPLQNISLVTELSPGHDSIIMRSGVSGMPDVLFTGDFTKTKDTQDFTALLKGKNLGSLLDYIGEVTKTDKAIDDTLLSQRDFEFTCKFQPDRRFVGGPLPFAVSLDTADASIFNGNVLFYPDTMDVRGSLESTNDMALALQKYFKIPSENIKQNFIRLDGDAAKYFHLEETGAAQTPAQ